MKKELKKLAVNKKMISLILTTTITFTSCGISISQNESSKTSSNEIGYVNTSSITSSKATSSKETSSANTSTEITSSMEVSSNVASSEEVSSKEVSSEISSKETSSKNVSSKETSSNEVSSKETSSNVTASKEESSKETSSKETSSTNHPISDSDYLASLPAYWQQRFQTCKTKMAYLKQYIYIVGPRSINADSKYIECDEMCWDILDLLDTVDSEELRDCYAKMDAETSEIQKIMQEIKSCLDAGTYGAIESYINATMEQKIPLNELESDIVLNRHLDHVDYAYGITDKYLPLTTDEVLNGYVTRVTKLYNEALNIYNSLGKQKTLTIN